MSVICTTKTTDTVLGRDVTDTGNTHTQTQTTQHNTNIKNNIQMRQPHESAVRRSDTGKTNEKDYIPK